MKKPALLMVGLALAVGLAGCGGASSTGSTTASKAAVAPKGATATQSAKSASTTAGAGATSATAYSQALTVSYSDVDLDASWNKSASSLITLAGGSVRFDGIGGTVSGTTVTISDAGTYVVSGTANDARIIVDAKNAKLVKLVLNGANLTCATSAPIDVESANKFVLVLADGTQNTITDGATYTIADGSTDEPNAAIFSKADFTINGGGSLTVNGKYKDGITSKDDLKLVSGTITVNAVDDGLTGKDRLGIKDATVTVKAGGDGLKSSNDVDSDKGYTCLSGGTVNITAGDDGIQAETTLAVTGGKLTVVAGGGNANAAPASPDQGQGGQNQNTQAAATDSSTKAYQGLKATGGVFITGGEIKVDAASDAIHSAASVSVGGGTLSLAAGRQGIQADENVVFTGGTTEVTTSFEGVEGNLVTIKDGTVRLRASDDGVNNKAAANSSGDVGLVVDGGYLYVNADGDGLDTNDGSIWMNGGTVIVNGPTGNMDGPLDYQGECKITGGFFLAVGSSGMAQSASDSSSQYSFMVNFDQAQTAGTIVHVQAADGSDVLTFAPAKQYQSVVLSSSLLKKGATYTVLVGGTATGTITDGVYAKATYSGGTQVTTLTLSALVTTYGSAGHGGGRQGGFGGGGPGGH